MEHRRHFLVITFPSQGHINPALQFAKRLVRLGMYVTFATSVFTHRLMVDTPAIEGLSFATFYDGNDDFFNPGDDPCRYMSELKRCGFQALPQIIETSANQGRPITCLVYTLLVPWAAAVARSFHIPSALLWVQPATVMDIYYYYFNGYGDVIRENRNNPSFSIEFPALPLLTIGDLPSNVVVLNAFALPTFEEHLQRLGEENYPKVLINTFDALETEPLRAIDKFQLIGIGPLIPSAFLDEEDPTDNSFGGDLFQNSRDVYIEWLNSKPQSSVVYISFGSISVLSKRQMEEMVRGLIDSRRPFLWVIRLEENREQENLISCREELKQQGMIVPWCSQVEVLSHQSVGCFVTHCGWNSTMESLACGVPMLAFPQWADQPTNAKLIESVWKTGVPMAVNEEGIVDADEVRRCLEMVMEDGESGEEMRRNAKKWKALAREAVKEGGSSDRNLKAFLDDEVGKGS